MRENDKKQHSGNTKQHDLNKSAAILQATFEHYYKMAMDHHTKAATTSNILLVIVGAIITVVGFDKKVGGLADYIGGLAVLLIGLFGAVWVWKQHERYYHWKCIACEYQEELTKIVPELKPEWAYKKGAEYAAAKDFGKLFAKKIEDRYLWVSLHLIVAVIGLGLSVVSIVDFFRE